MIRVYECSFCGVGVEYNTEDLQEHNEFDCCLACYYKESDRCFKKLKGVKQ